MACGPCCSLNVDCPPEGHVLDAGILPGGAVLKSFRNFRKVLEEIGHWGVSLGEEGQPCLCCQLPAAVKGTAFVHALRQEVLPARLLNLSQWSHRPSPLKQKDLSPNK